MTKFLKVTDTMTDWTYEEALRDNYLRRYGKEVLNMYDESTKQSVRDALVRNITPTEAEVKATNRIHNDVRREIVASGGSGDIPPSIARMYREYAEKQEAAELKAAEERARQEAVYRLRHGGWTHDQNTLVSREWNAEKTPNGPGRKYWR